MGELLKLGRPKGKADRKGENGRQREPTPNRDRLFLKAGTSLALPQGYSKNNGGHVYRERQKNVGGRPCSNYSGLNQGERETDHQPGRAEGNKP